MDRNKRTELQQQLIRLADGDRAAFHAVFSLVWPLAQRLASRLLPGRDADEAAQEALLKIFLRASEFDPSREALPWILGCVAYQCRTHARRDARREDQLANAERLPAESRTPESLAALHELEQALHEIIGTLSPLDRETILMVLDEEETLGGATFRKRLQRALARLRDAWRLKHGMG